jgi:hypothetical protein
MKPTTSPSEHDHYRPTDAADGAFGGKAMKPPNRKLGDPFEPRLVLMPDGTLAMADGSNVQAYLKAVRRKWKVKGKLPVSIAKIQDLLRLENDAFLGRIHGA